jgi:hypothetical protein
MAKVLQYAVQLMAHIKTYDQEIDKNIVTVFLALKYCFGLDIYL